MLDVLDVCKGEQRSAYVAVVSRSLYVYLRVLDVLDVCKREQRSACCTCFLPFLPVSQSIWYVRCVDLQGKQKSAHSSCVLHFYLLLKALVVFVLCTFGLSRGHQTSTVSTSLLLVSLELDVLAVCVFRASKAGLAAWRKSQIDCWGQGDSAGTYEWYQEWGVSKTTDVRCSWQYSNIHPHWTGCAFVTKNVQHWASYVSYVQALQYLLANSILAALL